LAHRVSKALKAAKSPLTVAFLQTQFPHTLSFSTKRSARVWGFIQVQLSSTSSFRSPLKPAPKVVVLIRLSVETFR